MPDVRLVIANRIYSVTCQPGEEAHLARLGAMVDEVARRAMGSTGGLTEVRMLLFAALLLADELTERNGAAPSPPELAATPTAAAAQGDLLAHDEAGDAAARAIERLASRLERLAETLEEMAPAA